MDSVDTFVWMPLESVYPINLRMFFSNETVISTLESRIIGGIGIIEGVGIVIIIDKRRGDVGRVWKNSVDGFLVLIC